jgi:hypothetical protein
MKRFWIILLAVAMALVIALPAGAGKPELDCDKHPNNPECTSDSEPPTDPPVLECAFDDNGVLTDSESGLPIELDRANSGIRCQLAADASDSFKFVISGNASVVSFPYIAVTDVYPYGGDICFRDYVSGQVVNPENEENHVFGTFATEGSLDTFGAIDGTCGEGDDTDGADTYALTFQVGGNIRGGTVQLMVTPPPMQD